ncbi:hypothetical protein SAMN05877838_3412 [Hoeflea halophila]|uniref:Uncharacterized protein n=1 Tax=Hoeflea halophila TaxID=714899 RepID=A0A286IEC8_9HYPH|nr:hypothetical protein SAMN05877838_3412 [Hoeflea halophila]
MTSGLLSAAVVSIVLNLILRETLEDRERHRPETQKAPVCAGAFSLVDPV